MNVRDTRSSLYGTTGWTLECGIRDLLSEHLSPWGDVSFNRFTDAGAELIGALAALLPPANLDDRQNHAPSLREFIAAALERPQEVTLSGYVVGPPRHDERVSIDGLTVLNTPIYAAGGWGSAPLGEDRMRVWRALGKYLGCEATTENCPDEIIPLIPSDTVETTGVRETQGWWVWWD